MLFTLHAKTKQASVCALLIILLFNNKNLRATSPCRQDEKISPVADTVWPGLFRKSKFVWDSLEKIIQSECNVIDTIIKKDSDSITPGKLDSFHDSKSLAALAIDLQLLKNRADRLHKTIANLKLLRKSPVKYEVNLIPEIEQGNTFYYQGEIVFTINGIIGFVHETTHGGQFEKGGIVYKKDNTIKKGGVLDDIRDEIDAYQMQFAFDTHSVAGLQSCWSGNSLQNINARWVRELRKSDGSKPYSCNGSAMIAQKSVTIHSSRRRILTAYRCLPDRYAIWPKGYRIKSDSNMYFRSQTPHAPPARPSSLPRSR